MTEAAIQEDVVEVPERGKGVELVPEVDAVINIEEKVSRDTVMENIAARRAKELQDEMGESEVKIEPIEPEVKVDKKIKVKVDGVESEVTEQEIREYQKQKAADKRLEDSARREKELNERQARLDDRERQLAQQAAIKVVEELDDSEELAEKLISSVFDEDKKTAADIIRKLKTEKGVSATQKIDQSEVNRAVTTALSERERQDAIAKFNTEYKDLAERPGLRTEVNERTKIEMRNDPDASWEDIIIRAAKFVRKDLAKIVGAKEEKPDVKTELEIRAEKKSELGNSVKTTVSAKDDMEVVPKGPNLTPIQQIMKSRGQPY